MKWKIIDGDDVSVSNAKTIDAVHPSAVFPVVITRVVEGGIIYTNCRVRIEPCRDEGCKHLVAETEEEKERVIAELKQLISKEEREK